MLHTAIYGLALIVLLVDPASGEESLSEVRTLEPETVVKPYMNRFSHGKVVPANAE